MLGDESRGESGTVLARATLLCGVGGRELVDWPVALLPRWGTRCSRWVSQFLRWVRSSLLAPCLLGFRHRLVSAGTIRPDGRSRRDPRAALVSTSRGTSRPPRGMGAGALRGGCPGSPSLGLTGSVLSLLLPRTPSPRTCPWKRCLFWSEGAKLLPLLSVKNMGPGEETSRETDRGRGGAAGSPRCGSPRGGGQQARRPLVPSLSCPGGGHSRGQRSGRSPAAHSRQYSFFKPSWREVSLPRAVKLEG